MADDDQVRVEDDSSDDIKRADERMLSNARDMRDTSGWLARRIAPERYEYDRRNMQEAAEEGMRLRRSRQNVRELGDRLRKAMSSEAPARKKRTAKRD